MKKAKKTATKSSAKTTKKAAKPERDPRLPAAGSVITREHKGTVHEVTVLHDGFRYQDKTYRSLSKIAHEVTGTIWNGFLWFNLTARKPVAAGKE